MSRLVTLPPEGGLLSDGSRLGGWWHDDAEPGRIVCDLCPRDCHLRPGDRGFCFVRENRDGQMVLSTYGRSTGFCIDPIEKKPLNHFYPGTSVLSFGTAGCNLGCKFCQNWSISKSREIEQLSENASPRAIAQAALRLGCNSVAFTYNDPVIWAEYAIDTARACREMGVKTVAVTAGYISPAARPAFYESMDAANVDLKAFTENFYRHLTLSHLEPVKETLRWLVHESQVWTEITNLIIPEENDSPDELKAMCDWILEALGPNVPVHFTAFHPDFRLTNRGRTPIETLQAAHDIAAGRGLNYVYVGNVHDSEHQTTRCASCKRPVIERTGYTIDRYELVAGCCRHCGAVVAGRYGDGPGDWGSQRQPVRIGDFEVDLQREAEVAATATVPVGADDSAVRRSLTAGPNDSTMAAANKAAQPWADQLSARQETAVLRFAAQILAASVAGSPMQPPADEELCGAADLPVLGAFVTLKRRGRLRGCCGFLGQSVPLAKAVAHAAQRTASDDHRFPPVSARELPFLEIDVWLLSNQQPVEASGEARLTAIEIGRHGLRVARGNASGLLLPGVAVEHNLDVQKFLEHVCLKARLPASAWCEDDTRLWTFEGQSFRSTLANTLPTLPSEWAAWPVTDADLPGLAEHCRGMLLDLLGGATPTYYAAHLPDGNVHGVAISVIDSAGREVLQGSRLSLRNTMPLQATLFSLTQRLTESLLADRCFVEHLEALRLVVTIFHQPAMHGTVADPDLAGIDPRRHLTAVYEHTRWAAMFDPEREAQQLIAEAANKAQVQSPEAAQAYTLEVLGGLPGLKIVHVPQPQAGESVRLAAVAGRFYPAEPAELAGVVDRCLAHAKGLREPWPAVMVPHAGLVYSGRVAGQALSRVRIPSTAIVIGPKHTPHGVEWAAAPHVSWSLPGATLAGDLELTRRLCEAIEGLQLDAAAHAEEHAIEVELPLLARLAPETKVVGIAIGGGNLERCKRFARGLAAVIRSLPEPPLLVISSDMNHFASDAENRRLDDLALRAMETGDPERLYQTVIGNRISMCGILPAVIVMETLRQLGRLSRVERVAYATSGETSGDESRVVGYAGVLLG